MSNKVIYLIFTFSLLSFVLIYTFLPTIEVKDVDYDQMTEERMKDVDSDPVYDDIENNQIVVDAYQGNIALNRVWLKLKLIFITHNKEIIDSGIAFDEYFENNKEKAKQIYGCETKDEFLKLFNSFKELGTDVYSYAVINDTVNVLQDSIEFKIRVVSNTLADELTYKNKFYKCTIYNQEKEKDVILKIEPFLEVE